MKKILQNFELSFGCFVGWGLLYLLWLVLFRKIDPVIMVSGVFVAGFVVFLYGRFELAVDIPLRSLARPLLWIKFFTSLVLEIGKSTVRTCYIILTGRVKGKIVAYDTKLGSGSGRLFLINSITLTPITIGILSEKNLVYIHHLHIEDRDDYEAVVDKIRSTFEDPLLKLLG
ncbi:Na+/H+ antiporter subunit E [Candidatus Bipolaricaulota bacterium]|nr:Na+/H+ antiporter subunit E [Candidatus Bipolaricaulota bacterium]